MKQRDIPKKITINGNEWILRFVKDLSAYDTRSETCQGICLFKSKEMLVKTNMPKKEMLTIVLHEGLHAIEEEYGIKIDHKIVYALSKAMSDIYFDNFERKPSVA